MGHSFLDHGTLCVPPIMHTLEALRLMVWLSLFGTVSDRVLLL
jgi:hypothetical protein